jgi:Ca2+-binding EF-hand superfamily protein
VNFIYRPSLIKPTMGNCYAVDSFMLGVDLEEEWKEWEHVFKTINFSKAEFVHLYKLFRKIDTDKSGLIDLRELAVYLKIEADVFLCRCFAIFDEDDSGFIDFGEFVLSLWNYCTHSPDTLMLFAFNLFNVDKTGYMSKEEIVAMLRTIYRSGTALDKVHDKMVRSRCCLHRCPYRYYTFCFIRFRWSRLLPIRRGPLFTSSSATITRTSFPLRSSKFSLKSFQTSCSQLIVYATAYIRKFSGLNSGIA